MTDEIDASVKRLYRDLFVNGVLGFERRTELLRAELLAAEQRGAAAAEASFSAMVTRIDLGERNASTRLRDAAQRAREIGEKLDHLERGGSFVHVDAPIMATVRDFLRELSEETK